MLVIVDHVGGYWKFPVRWVPGVHVCLLCGGYRPMFMTNICKRSPNHIWTPYESPQPYLCQYMYLADPHLNPLQPHVIITIYINEILTDIKFRKCHRKFIYTLNQKKIPWHILTHVLIRVEIPKFAKSGYACRSCPTYRILDRIRYRSKTNRN